MSVDVFLWGTKIGMLDYEPGQTEIATFEYDENFIKVGIELSPINVSTQNKIYNFDNISFNTFHGLPGFIADSLPDKFGNQLIDQYFTQKGKNNNEITALDRLLYIGDRGLGALEYRPSIDFNNSQDTKLDLRSLSELAELVLNKKDILKSNLNNADKESALKLLKVGSSAGGARSKALVALDSEGNIYDGTINHANIKCKYYLLKFDNDNNSDRDNKDPKGMTKIEYIYSLFAKKCDIDTPITDYIEDGDDFHFLIERFDRINKGNKLDKLHYVSWCGMAHAHRDITGAYSYEQLVLTARNIGLGQDTAKEIFKRAVFNIVGKNQDDHTKNFGFLMDRQGNWRLSPSFDMTYSYDPLGKWTKNHQINLNGKQNSFTKEDIITFGKYCGLNKNKSLDILNKTIYIFKKFEEYADKYNVSDKLKTMILNNLRTDIVSNNSQSNTAMNYIRAEMQNKPNVGQRQSNNKITRQR